jgi:hypothetical protein
MSPVSCRKRPGLEELRRALLVLAVLGAALAPARRSAAQQGCSPIDERHEGWILELCTDDPSLSVSMEVLLDGASQGSAELVRVYHRAEAGGGTPQVFVLYASGFLRLKPNADPVPPLPFGSSFILGPGYWPSPKTYHHNPELRRLEIDTRGLPHGPLRLRAEGSNHDFDTVHEMRLPPPRDRQSRLHVTQTVTATAPVAIDPTRRTERQGFKLAQVSSMHITEGGGTCDGGLIDCHDSDAARFVGDDLARRQARFLDVQRPGFIFSAPRPLASPWLDVLHTDDAGWQGNTPNVRIALEALPEAQTVTPQGYIGATTNPNDDNVNVWLHDDGPGSQSWTAGQRSVVRYWLLAQDDPPEPWADAGLRGGLPLVDFENAGRAGACVQDGAALCCVGPGSAAGSALALIAGYSDTALELSYALDSPPSIGQYAQIRCDFNPPLDLSAYDHLRLDWRGDPARANTIEVGLTTVQDATPGNVLIDYRHATHRGWWGQLVVPFDLYAAEPLFNPGQVSALFVSVTVRGGDPPDVGGAGRIAIDNVAAVALGPREVPAAFEPVRPRPAALEAAAGWLASRVPTPGPTPAPRLLKSWDEEPACLAHLYDQALALLVFVRERRWAAADALAGGLAALQEPDGSWFETWDCSTGAKLGTRWEGAAAWTVFALSRYLDAGGLRPGAAAARDLGAQWLASRVGDPCLAFDHTEATIDVWWALDTAGPGFEQPAAKLRQCLETVYWNEAMGRFKGGQTPPNAARPYLDNQTWGAAFWRAVGDPDKARRALSYARAALRLPAQGGQLLGLDGQGGPWSVWNEGTAQYVAEGGQDAEELALELLAQQRPDGAMPGGPDEFNGAGVWTSRWHGVAPTAWLYFALSGEPFPPSTPAPPVLGRPAPREARVWLLLAALATAALLIARRRGLLEAPGQGAAAGPGTAGRSARSRISTPP